MITVIFQTAYNAEFCGIFRHGAAAWGNAGEVYFKLFQRAFFDWTSAYVVAHACYPQSGGDVNLFF